MVNRELKFCGKITFAPLIGAKISPRHRFYRSAWLLSLELV